MLFKKFTTVSLCILLLAGCSQKSLYKNKQVAEAQVTDRTSAGILLAKLPPPSQKIAVAVYDFGELIQDPSPGNTFYDAIRGIDNRSKSA